MSEQEAPTLAELEAANERRVKELQRFGLNELALTITAMGVRIELIVQHLIARGINPTEFDMQYEVAMAAVLQGMLNEASQPRLALP